MKEKFMLAVKGFILGIANIIPGVSGGTLAVLLGIYEDMIEAASNFYKSLNSFKKYFMFLFPILLKTGMINIIPSVDKGTHASTTVF